MPRKGKGKFTYKKGGKSNRKKNTNNEDEVSVNGDSTTQSTTQSSTIKRKASPGVSSATPNKRPRPIQTSDEIINRDEEIVVADEEPISSLEEPTAAPVEPIVVRVEVHYAQDGRRQERIFEPVRNDTTVHAEITSHLHSNYEIYNSNHSYFIVTVSFLRYGYGYGIYCSSIYYSTNAMWAVPKPKQIPLIEAIGVIFKKTVWAAIIVSIILTSIVWWLIVKYEKKSENFSTILLNTWGLTLLGCVNNAPVIWATRFLVITYIIGFIHIQAVLNSKIVEVLTIPQYEHGIRKLEELLESDLPIIIHPYIQPYVFKKEDIEMDVRHNKVQQLLSNFTNPEGIERVVVDCLSKSECAAFFTGEELYLDNDVLEISNIINDNSLTGNFDSVLACELGSYISITFNKLVDAFVESGIMSEFTKKLETEKSSFVSKEPETPLDLEAIGVIFKKTVWTAIIVSIILTSIDWWLIVKYEKKSENFSTILLNTWGLTRFLVIAYIIGFIHIQAVLKSKIVEVLTIPQYEHGIRKLEELLESDLPIIIHPYIQPFVFMKKYIEMDVRYNKVQQLLSNFTDAEGIERVVVDCLAKSECTAFFTGEEPYLDNNVLEISNIINDNSLTGNFDSILACELGSYIAITFNKLVDAFVESGIMIEFTKKLETGKSSFVSREPETPLDLEAIDQQHSEAMATLVEAHWENQTL
ncbi:hypothetical protein FQR65_LT07976 [Abscondita terminalis]|nr:hypothetical protein FQR65_LT07976 [Abscondita terminalis]